MRVYKPTIKIAEAPEVEPGMVLLSQEFWNNNELQRSVILLLEHDENGSTGVIINKLTNLKVNEVLPLLPVNQPLFYGGHVNVDRIGFIHQNKNILRSVRISKEFYWCGNIYQMKALIEQNELSTDKIKFFAGLVEWGPGELNSEIYTKKWWMSDLTFQELLEAKYDLWTLKLIEQGNLYGLLHEVPDPVLS